MKTEEKEDNIGSNFKQGECGELLCTLENAQNRYAKSSPASCSGFMQTFQDSSFSIGHLFSLPKIPDL